jgi:hypothetical protein
MKGLIQPGIRRARCRLRGLHRGGVGLLDRAEVPETAVLSETCA